MLPISMLPRFPNIIVSAFMLLDLLPSGHAVDSSASDTLDLGAMIQPVTEKNFFSEPGFFTWCNSVIRDERGKYHLFYSRWPKELGFSGWLTHSRIAHAVADSPAGPYLPDRQALEPRKGKWDSLSVHNVKVERFGGKYYLYYTSANTGDVKLSEKDLREIAKTGYGHKYWMTLRNNQRSGVAVSPTLTGPWKRLDQPVVEPQTPIAHVTVNPAVAQGPDGLFRLIIKGDDKTLAEQGKRKMIQATGHSKSPEGPFILEEQPAFADIPTEDTSLWYDRERKRFYAIFHAHRNNYLGLITSSDGIHWQKAKHYRVCNKEIPMADGTVMKVDGMERPLVYLENGRPVQLSVAVKNGDDSFIVFFPLKEKS